MIAAIVCSAQRSLVTDGSFTTANTYANILQCNLFDKNSGARVHAHYQTLQLIHKNDGQKLQDLRPLHYAKLIIIQLEFNHQEIYGLFTNQRSITETAVTQAGEPIIYIYDFLELQKTHLNNFDDCITIPR